MDHSQSPKARQQPDDGRKVFITNIDGAQAQQAVQTELRRLFSRFGSISKLNVKKNKNGLYSFAFLEFQKTEDANNAIAELDQYQIFGKRMRVRQDRQSEGCFHCKKSGHFARQCPQNKEREARTRNYQDQRRENNYHQYRERDERERHYRDQRERPNEKYERRYREERDERRYDRRRHERSRDRSYSPDNRRRGYHSRSRSESYDRRYRSPPRHQRYYADRRRDDNRRDERRDDRRDERRDERRDDRRQERREQYYSRHNNRRSHSSRSYSSGR